MSLADLMRGRAGRSARLPTRIEELRGPGAGVIKLPRYLSWPGLTECDVADPPNRRAMYGLVLSQGKRGDMTRLLNAALLRQDWAAIAPAIDARLRRECERRFALAPSGDTAAAG